MGEVAVEVELAEEVRIAEQLAGKRDWATRHNNVNIVNNYL